MKQKRFILFALLTLAGCHATSQTAPVKAQARSTQAKIVAGARAQIGIGYDPAYVKLTYPGGDVAKTTGVCTDVVVRALRAGGRDLQKLMHEDMTRHFALYPSRKKWGLKRPDSNIDHRRVPNQMVFFRRFGKELTQEVRPKTLAQWQPGDIVCWDLNPAGLKHTGIVSDKKDANGMPFVIHNLGGCREENALTSWKIIGHFRYPVR